MSNSLDQFINENREDFDDEIPANKIWDNIRKQLQPAKEKQTPVIHINWKKLSVAAAVIILLGGGILLMNKKNNVPPQIAVDNTKKKIDNNLPKVQPAIIDSLKSQMAQTVIKSKEETKKESPAPDDQVADYKEEMYHFAKLVEIKHKELSKIEKDEPLLYKQFSGDVNKLDSVYRSLEKQLPENPNREQLIEAMIQNLQLQMDLLNHQLTIIKKINHSKKSAYEKAIKSA
jgi:hypothetical protein